MELQEALSRIDTIRNQIAQTETFRGYRSATVGFSSALAFAAATLQTVWIPKPANHVTSYLTLWIGVAVISVLITGTEMVIRGCRSSSSLHVRLTWMAVLQFLPCVVAGALVTYVMLLFANETAWMLPGLWAILFSLGMFASCRLLPQPIVWVGAYYLAAGVVCLACGRGDAAFSPWSMAGTFGIGQLLTAIILYRTLERTRE